MGAASWVWPIIGTTVSLLLGAQFARVLLARRWTARSLVVALPCLLVALLHSVAPFRGSIDANYFGYGFGFISLDGGPLVALVAGAIFVAFAAAALIAAGNRQGAAMWVVAAASAFMIVNVGGYLLLELLRGQASFQIQLGEYLTIPPAAAAPIMLLVQVLPFAIALPWAVRQARVE